MKTYKMAALILGAMLFTGIGITSAMAKCGGEKSVSSAPAKCGGEKKEMSGSKCGSKSASSTAGKCGKGKCGS